MADTADRARRAGNCASGLTVILHSDEFAAAIAAARVPGLPASEVFRELAIARDLLEEIALEGGA